MSHQYKLQNKKILFRCIPCQKKKKYLAQASHMKVGEVETRRLVGWKINFVFVHKPNDTAGSFCYVFVQHGTVQPL